MTTDSTPARRARDPRAVDVVALCRAADRLEGVIEPHTLERLAPSLWAEHDAPPAGGIAWSAGASTRPVRGGEPELWLHLQARGPVRLQCQRCLQAVAVELEVDRRFRFVAGEDEAARLDEESEDDVLALPARLNLVALIEDELILALPIVPRHEVCAAPLAALPAASSGAAAAAGEPGAPGGDTETARENPFAVLAALRRGPP